MIILISILFLFIILCGRYSISQNRYFSEVQKKFGYYLFISFLFFITVLRFNVGYDYHTYYVYLIAKESWGEKFFEPIPRFVLILARRLNIPLLFFIFINSLILILFIKGIQEESNNFFESFGLFLSLFYLTSLSTIRQWLAISIIFYGFKYVKQRKLFKYIVCVILATLCHYSAIVSISIYFIYNFINPKFSLVLCLLLFLCGGKIVAILLNLPFLSSYSHYFKNIYVHGGSKSVFIYYVLFLFSLIVYIKSKNKKKIEKLFSLVCYGLVFPKLLGPTMGSRISVYFDVFYIYLLPLNFDKIKDFGLRKFFMYIFFLYYVLYLVIDSLHDKGYTNYIFYFFKDGL